MLELILAGEEAIIEYCTIGALEYLVDPDVSQVSIQRVVLEIAVASEELQ